MHFLIIDPRFGTPIYVFLEVDPDGAETYPGFPIRQVVIEPAASGHHGRTALGRNPHRLDLFREFGSDGAATVAGFILIEPQYVGPTWEAYTREFRPQGEKPQKKAGRTGTEKPYR